MDFKKKWQRFWTLDRHHDGGFTLVELIIVIAIMAILAGVAVPAYQGYIGKAKTAGDQQLLDAVNKAFASACMEAKVDAENVTEAEISVIDQQVYGLSKVASTVTATSGDANANYGTIASAFLRYYVEANPNAVFKTENINSLLWNADVLAFELSSDYVATNVTLSSGKTITISAEDMKSIQESAYAAMGYSGVKEVIDNVGTSGKSLAAICGAVYTNILKGETLVNKLTAAMKSYGLIDATKEAELNKNLKITNMGKDSYTTATNEAANGLSMITAKYLASGGNVDELLSIDLGNNSTGVIKPMASGSGGTKTVSAIAMQYAMVAGFAESEYASDVKIGNQTVSEYLASADDPIKAIDTVKNLDAYKNNYVGSDQYTSDKDGFVGTMSILGDNIGTTSKPGNIDINDYLSNGLGSQDAKDILTGVLGE